MRLIKDYNVPVTDGVTKIVDGEPLLICPICDQDITYAIDDYDAAYECPNCLNAIKFPMLGEGE